MINEGESLTKTEKRRAENRKQGMMVVHSEGVKEREALQWEFQSLIDDKSCNCRYRNIFQGFGDFLLETRR